MSETFDTSLGPPAPHPRSTPPKDPYRDYYHNLHDGQYYAVEKLGIVPARAVGPIAPADLARDVESLDWAKAVNASLWNVRFLIRLCPREKALVLGGKKRQMTFARQTSLPFKAAILGAIDAGAVGPEAVNPHAVHDAPPAKQ